MKEDSTENKILEAAENIFTVSGYDGARMQAIADLAGINKAMLHYYYRSKDSLFERIFDQKVKDFFPDLSDLMQNQIPFLDKSDAFIDRYISLMIRFPYLPNFVVNTINKANAKNFIPKLPTHLIGHLAKSFDDAKAKGEVKNIDTLQFIFSLLAMCIFPFLVRPIIQNVFEIENFKDLMEKRKVEVKKYVRFIVLE